MINKTGLMEDIKEGYKRSNRFNGRYKRRFMNRFNKRVMTQFIGIMTDTIRNRFIGRQIL